LRRDHRLAAATDGWKLLTVNLRQKYSPRKLVVIVSPGQGPKRRSAAGEGLLCNCLDRVLVIRRATEAHANRQAEKGGERSKNVRTGAQGPCMRRNIMRNYAVAGMAWLALTAPAAAHFQELIPSRDIVTAASGRTVTLDAVFTHPFEGGPVMEMGAPRRFGVLVGGAGRDLRPLLEERPVGGRRAFRITDTINRPGDHVYYLEPAPYWEPAEKIMIVHYTKVVVGAFGAEDGWDAMVGFPIEIEPLVRPYGLWTGNLFRGVVRQDGKPMAFATVEVAWRNDGRVKAPADAFVTQVIKADGAGVFAYAMPRAGWWGFAALSTSEERIPGPDGQAVPVELGALIWVRTTDMN
jgi:cobalt/nickel transport protein